MIKEGGLLSHRLHQCQAHAGEGHLEGQAGEAGPGAHVYDAASFLYLVRQHQGNGEGVEEVSGLYLGVVNNAGEVNTLVPGGQLFIVTVEVLKLAVGEG